MHSIQFHPTSYQKIGWYDTQQDFPSNLYHSTFCRIVCHGLKTVSEAQMRSDVIGIYYTSLQALELYGLAALWRYHTQPALKYYIFYLHNT